MIKIKLLTIISFSVLSCLYITSSAAPAPKVDICHKFNLISVSGNALEAHLAHGDGIVGVDVDEDCIPIIIPPPPVPGP